MQEVLGNKGKGGRKFSRDLTFIRMVVTEYKLSDLSMRQVAEKFGVTRDQVYQWIRRFSSELTVETFSPMTPEEQQQLDALKKQNEELKKKLDLANLKITGLEMIIDIAEDQLQIDIRKKPGTKQSEG